jgi:hypothetical protein
MNNIPQKFLEKATKSLEVAKFPPLNPGQRNR